MLKAFIVYLILALALAGCSVRYQGSASSSSTTSGGSQATVTSNSSGLRVHAAPGSVAAALIAISLLAGAIEYSREPRPFPSPSALLPDAPAPAPELAGGRVVNEQDCTKPIVDWSANLKCR